MATAAVPNTEPAYTHTSEPHAVSAGNKRPKYRDAPASLTDSQGFRANLMWDKRVVRGSTYASHVLPTTVAPDPVSTQKTAEKRKLKDFKKRTKEKKAKPTTPEPVAGRSHMDVQTEQYLEEISDRPTEETLGTQTDAMLDRPPSPRFIPQKLGEDKETQIEEGDLFDFDFEVGPILEVLTGKTLEQALMEVLEEEELAAIRAHEEEFDQKRAAELAEAQRMEEAERRRLEEKENRMRQEQERMDREKVTSHKVAARGFAKLYVSNVMSEVFDNLANEGVFYDPLVREMEEGVLPWLLEGVEASVNAAQAAATIVNKSIASVMSLREQRTAAARDAYAAKVKAKEEAAAAEAERLAAEKAAAEEEARKAAEAAEGEGEGAQEGEENAE